MKEQVTIGEHTYPANSNAVKKHEARKRERVVTSIPVKLPSRRDLWRAAVAERKRNKVS